MVTPATVTFEESTCGDTKTASLTLTNTRAERRAVAATLGSSDTFTLLGAAADGSFRTELAPNESRTLTLTAKNAAPGTKTGEVVVTAGAESASVPLQLVTHGATLTLVPSVVDFGAIRRDTTPPPLPVLFRNNGDIAITVTGLAGTTADFTLPSSVVVPANGEASSTVAMKAGAAGSALSSTGTPILTVPLCGPTPTLTLKGQRVNQDVTVNPATLELAPQPCNTSPTVTAKVTISNYSTTDGVSFTATLPTPSRFKLASSTTGTVPKASSPMTPGLTEITIGLNPTGATPGTFDEDLVVNVGGAIPRADTLKVHVDVTGAVLAFSSPSLVFTGFVSTSIRVTNTGNVKACFNYQSSGDSQLSTENEDELAPGASDPTEVRWQRAAESGDGTVTVTSKACPGAPTALPFCTPAPVLAVEHR